MKNIFDVKGNGKNYSVGDIVTVVGKKGKINWVNSAKKLLDQTTMWEGVVSVGDKVAEVKFYDNTFGYLIF